MKKGTIKTAVAVGTGVAIGAAAGVLFAPKSGSETRKELKAKIDDLIDKAKQIKKEDVVEYIETRANQLKEEIEDLDKEKVLEAAKKKSKQIQKKAQDLVDYAVKKGTPALESVANSVRESAIKVTKDVLKKLEDK